MKNFNDVKTTHEHCVVDNGDYGMIFHRFTGTVLAQYGREFQVVLVDVEEYRRAYGVFPPNETLNTALDFGYWYLSKPEADATVLYDPPEREFREALLSEKLFDLLLPPDTKPWGLRDIEIRPWKRDTLYEDIVECKPEQAEGWGLYGRTFAGPGWHLLDVDTKEQAYWVRAALARYLVVDPNIGNRYEAAQARAEALEGVKFDEGG